MSDKLNKNINQSMLEGLLSDTDKPKPPAPVARTYPVSSYGYRYADDDGYDDYGYRGARARSTYSPAPAATSYGSGFDISAATINAAKAALAGGMHSGQKHYFMPANEANALANALVRGIGEIMDKVGLTFGASGSKNARALVLDMLGDNMFYNTPTRGYKELDFGDTDSGPLYDEETGELLSPEVDVERAAIREVDGADLSPKNEEE